MTDPATPAITGAPPSPAIMAPSPAIRVRGLTHRFGAHEVLHDVSFDVAAGEIFGFIGPNGAGKTTTIRVLATLLEPTEGQVEVDGIDVTLEPEAVRAVIGYMPDHAGVYERITVREYLEFFAAAYRVGMRRERPAEIGESSVLAVLELTDLGKLQDKLVATMSKGQKQRLQLARVLLHDPKVLVLDEPASDLDPRARIEIRELLVELRALGKTVFLSSHILTELADVCTSVAILERGRLVAAGPIAEIGARVAARGAADAAPGSARVRVRVLGDGAAVDAAATAVRAMNGVRGVEIAGGALLVAHGGGDRELAAIVEALVRGGALVVGVEPEKNELERIFLEVTRGEMQ